MVATLDDNHPLDFFPEEETGDERVDSLMLIDKARAALAQAETLSDIGAVREIAERARRYASAAKLGRAAENHAARLRLEAERKAGALLAEAPKHPAGRPPENRSPVVTDSPPRLQDLGVTKKQSSDWQRMAKVPDSVFEAHVERAQRKGEALTTSSVVQVARQIEREQRAAAPKPTVEPSSVPARIEVADARGLPLLDETVDLIVTSPPYGLDVDYDCGDVDPYLWPTFMVTWLKETWRVAKWRGRLALNVPLDVSEPYPRPTYAQALTAAVEAGWEYQATITWHEGNTTKGNRSLGSVNSSARPHPVDSSEMIAIFSKGEWEPSSTNTDDITPEEWQVAGRGPWTFSGESRPWEDHPAPFPEELPRRLIRYLCRVGDVVLDPFVGSGTTALVALQTGRQAIGFDRSQKYVDSTLRRLAAYGERPSAMGMSSAGAGVPGPRAEAGEPGGLRSGLDRIAGGASEQERVPAGTMGVEA